MFEVKMKKAEMLKSFYDVDVLIERKEEIKAIRMT
jgi:hypothetical protein